jgi:hypothetical protein
MGNPFTPILRHFFPQSPFMIRDWSKSGNESYSREMCRVRPIRLQDAVSGPVVPLRELNVLNKFRNGVKKNKGIGLLATKPD